MDLPTYTSIWRIEKRLYKLYDFRLPMPLPVGQIAVFAGIAVPYVILLTVAGLPFSHTLFWLYVLPPGVLTWLATRPVLESKRLPELIISQARYLSEPRTWCRLAPLAEEGEIHVSARVWRRVRGPAGQPGLEDGQAQALARQAPDAVAPAQGPAGAEAPGGVAREPAGVAREPAGVAREPAGVAQPGHGRAWHAAGQEALADGARGQVAAAQAPGPAGAAGTADREGSPRRRAMFPLPGPSQLPPHARPGRALPHPLPTPGQEIPASLRREPAAAGGSPVAPGSGSPPGRPSPAAGPPPAAAGPPPAAAGPPPAAAGHTPGAPAGPQAKDPGTAAMPRALRIVSAGQAPARPAPLVERALSRPAGQRSVSWHGHVRVVPGGYSPGQLDRVKRDRMRAAAPLGGPRLVAILGCSVGAGQTVTALMLAGLLARLRGQPVAALDLNPGPASLTRQAQITPVASVSALLAGRAGTMTQPPSPGRLDVIAADAPAQVPLPAGDLGHQRLYGILASRYPLVVADPGAVAVARTLAAADQLVLVAPASPDAARAAAMTLEWLDANRYGTLLRNAIAVMNGVSKRSAVHASQAEAVLKGRCRAIVRVPWDAHLGEISPGIPGSQPRSPLDRVRPAVLDAYTALAGVVIAALAAPVAQRVAGHQPAVTRASGAPAGGPAAGGAPAGGPAAGGVAGGAAGGGGVRADSR